MKNKKGFTLVELLAVVLILGILSLIAVPNVISIIDNNKKDIVLSDARKLISQAKLQVNIDKDIREKGTTATGHKFYFKDLNANNDIKTDADGATIKYADGSKHAYSEDSYVLYKVENGIATYCVYLKSTQRKLETASGRCVNESNLFDRNNVIDKN